MLIFRYFVRQIYPLMLGVTALLLFAVIFAQLIHNLQYAVSGRHSLVIALELTLLQIPLLLGYVLALGLYVSILLVYSRMYIDSEMTVLSACGLGRQQLVAMTLLYTFPIALMVACVALWIQPKTFYYEHLIVAQGKATAIANMITPGVFHDLPGRRVIYVNGQSSSQGNKKNVFLAQLPTQAHPAWKLVLAEDMGKELNPETRVLSFLLKKGHFYSGVPGEQKAEVGYFDKAALYIQPKNIQVDQNRAHLKLTPVLWQERKTNLSSRAELQMRLSMPLSVLVLALIAIPLTRIGNRQARQMELFAAIFLYALYMISLFVAQNTIQHNDSWGQWSMLVVHLSFLSCAAFLFWKKR